MRYPHHARMSVIRRGEKELRLNAFLARGLAGMTMALQPADRDISAIARSVASPVVRSIASCARELAAAGGTVRLILARPDGLALVGADPLTAIRAASLACEVRLTRNPRLIEAHEQLTIGARVTWTGDAMRRDPATCDAYESFMEDCPEIAAVASATFERLWRDCAPLPEVGSLTPGAQGAIGMPREVPPPR